MLKWCNPGWQDPRSQLEHDRCWSLFVSSHHFTPVWIVIFITAGVGMTSWYTMVPSVQHAARHQPHNNITNGLDQNLTANRISLLFPPLTWLYSHLERALSIYRECRWKLETYKQYWGKHFVCWYFLVGAIKVRHEPVNYLTGLIAPPCLLRCNCRPCLGSRGFQRSHGRKVEIEPSLNRLQSIVGQ